MSLLSSHTVNSLRSSRRISFCLPHQGLQQFRQGYAVNVRLLNVDDVDAPANIAAVPAQ